MNDEDNRKRGYHDEIDDAISSKRAALGGGGPVHPDLHIDMSTDALYFKILCPQGIAGLIIGRGGSIINQLNATCGARIKLSQNNEFFPGTTDRILVLSGCKEGIANGLRELITRIAEAPEKRPSSMASGPSISTSSGSSDDVTQVQFPGRGPSGAFMLKVLVPRAAAPALIGKGGAVIKQMSELSGCKMQLGDDVDPFGTKERLLFINAVSVPNLVLGAQTIMAQLLDDPRIRDYAILTTNYDPNAPPPYRGDRGGGQRNGGGQRMQQHMMQPHPHAMQQQQHQHQPSQPMPMLQHPGMHHQHQQQQHHANGNMPTNGAPMMMSPPPYGMPMHPMPMPMHGMPPPFAMNPYMMHGAPPPGAGPMQPYMMPPPHGQHPQYLGPMGPPAGTQRIAQGPAGPVPGPYYGYAPQQGQQQQRPMG